MSGSASTSGRSISSGKISENLAPWASIPIRQVTDGRQKGYRSVTDKIDAPVADHLIRRLGQLVYGCLLMTVTSRAFRSRSMAMASVRRVGSGIGGSLEATDCFLIRVSRAAS